MKTQIAFLLIAAGLICCVVESDTSGQNRKRKVAQKDAVRRPAAQGWRGTIQSANNVELRSELPGKATILSLVKEGSQVKKGDLIAELDSSAFQEKIAVQKLEVAAAQADLIQAEAALELAAQRRAMMKNIRTLDEKARKLATEALLASGGELDVRQKAAESAVKIHQAKLEAVEIKMAQWKREKGDGGPPAELRLASVEAAETLKQAMRELELIKKFERPRAAAELAVEQARRAQETMLEIQESEAQISAAKSKLEAVKVNLAAQRDELDRSVHYLKRSQILAPAAGTVVFAHRPRADVVIEEGAIVRERQTIAVLPDLTKLEVRMLVPEAVVNRLRVGKPATVVVDAYPDRKLEAVIRTVATFPDPSRWDRIGKMYAVIVTLPKDAPSLKIGMTASITFPK